MPRDPRFLPPALLRGVLPSQPPPRAFAMLSARVRRPPRTPAGRRSATPISVRELLWLTDHARGVKEGTTQPGERYFDGWWAPALGGREASSAAEEAAASASREEEKGRDLRTVLRRLDRSLRERVLRGLPLQYVLGSQPFAGLDLEVRRPILIPRWETEEWVVRLAELVLDRSPHVCAREPPSTTTYRILDLCTGSGCVALGLVSLLSRPWSSAGRKVEAVGVDVEPVAVELARTNASRNGIACRQQAAAAPPPSSGAAAPSSWCGPARGVAGTSSCDFVLADLCDDASLDAAISETGPARPFDILVANPPYVSHAEYDDDGPRPRLSPEVKRWEDKKALVAGAGGTAFHERIADMAGRLLRSKPEPNGLPEIVMEFGGAHQSEVLVSMLRSKGFRRTEIWEDSAGEARVIAASRDTAGS